MVSEKLDLLLAEFLYSLGGVDSPAVEHVAREGRVRLDAPIVFKRDEVLIEQRIDVRRK
jgi:hypothetical protein